MSHQCPRCGTSAAGAAAFCIACGQQLTTPPVAVSLAIDPPIRQPLPPATGQAAEPVVPPAVQGVAASDDDLIAQALPPRFWRKRRFQGAALAGLVVVIGIGAWIAAQKSHRAVESIPADVPVNDASGVAAQRRAEAEERHRQSVERDELKDAIRARQPSRFCHRVASEASHACNVLVFIAHDGRSKPYWRDTLQQYLKKKGYKKIAGYIIARHDDGLYEAAYLQDTDFGPMPSGRFILLTHATEYSSKGRFALWAIERDKRQITTTDGFSQSWKVFEETPFGNAVEMVFRAPAGNETTAAATETLKALTLNR